MLVTLLFQEQFLKCHLPHKASAVASLRTEGPEGRGMDTHTSAIRSSFPVQGNLSLP